MLEAITQRYQTDWLNIDLHVKYYMFGVSLIKFGVSLIFVYHYYHQQFNSDGDLSQLLSVFQYVYPFIHLLFVYIH